MSDDILIRISEDVGQLKGTTDAILRTQQEVTTHLYKINGRVGRLERARTYGLGILAGLTVVLTAMGWIVKTTWEVMHP